MDIKGVVKPKKGFKTYILQCRKCKHKIFTDLRRKQKTIKGKCEKCGIVTRLKIVGEIIRFYKRWDSLKLRYYHNLPKKTK
jgi:hypothetical protein